MSQVQFIFYYFLIFVHILQFVCIHIQLALFEFAYYVAYRTSIKSFSKGKSVLDGSRGICLLYNDISNSLLFDIDDDDITSFLQLMQAVMLKDTSSDLALAVDIWSLGCTIIEMFTGKPPWNEYEGVSIVCFCMPT